MKFLATVLDKWASVVRSTWRAFAVFQILVVLAVIYQVKSGDFEGMDFAEIVDDVVIAVVLMFVAAFVTSLIYHYSVWRNGRWPGGGGRR